MTFLTLSNANIVFADWELTWKFYTIAEVLLTTKRVEIINKKKIAKAELDKNIEVFIIHIALLILQMSIDLNWKAQIALLMIEKMVVLAKYFEYANVFLKKSAIKLFKHFDINEHLIDLEPSKQPPYKLVYSLEPVELKTLKIYIKTHIANSFT